MHKISFTREHYVHNHEQTQQESPATQKFNEGVDQWANENLNIRYAVAQQIKEAYVNNSTSLTIYELAVDSLPEEIGQLTALKKLDLTGLHNIRVLPESINQLVNLENLYLGSTGLSFIPQSVLGLPNLKVLTIHSANNLIFRPDPSDFDHHVDVQGEYHLPTMKISAQKFNEGVDRWANEDLNRRNADAQRIKEAYVNNSTSLTIYEVAVDSLPEEIGQLTALKKLDLTGLHNIRVLPESINQLVNLENLYLGSTGLSFIPQSVLGLPNLKVLTIHSANNLIFRPGSSDFDHRVDVQGEYHLPTVKDFVQKSNKDLIIFPRGEEGIQKFRYLVDYARNQIERDAKWAIKNNVFLNQLLYQASNLPENTEDALRAKAELLRVFAYHSLPGFSELTDLLQEQYIYDPEDHNHALIFLAEEGNIGGILIRKEFYEQKILNFPATENQEKLSWDSFAWYPRSQNGEFQANASSNIEDMDAFLAPFPLLQQQYQMSPHSEKLMTVWRDVLKLEDEDIKLFSAAREVASFGKKLTEPDEQARLLKIFSSLVTGIGNNARVVAPASCSLQEEHFQDLIRVLGVQDDNPRMAVTLFSLSAFFTRASSKEIFGEENASPVALRYYALALLNKAINIQPNLVLQEKLADYQSRLAGDSCSNELYIDMSLIARDLTEDNTYIAPVWNAYVPSAWRYGRDLTRQA